MTRPGGIRSTTSSTRSANSVGSPSMSGLLLGSDPSREERRADQRAGEAEQRRDADPAAQDDQARRVALDLDRIHRPVVEPPRAAGGDLLVAAQLGGLAQRGDGVHLAEPDQLVPTTRRAVGGAPADRLGHE